MDNTVKVGLLMVYLMTLIQLLVAIVTNHGNLTTNARAPFTCPHVCKCANIDTGITGIAMVCSFNTLSKGDNFGILQGYNIKWLTIKCNNINWYSELKDGGFMGLTDLLQLNILSCTLRRISSQTFLGLDSLQNLTILGLHRSTIFSYEWPTPLMNLRRLDTSGNNIQRLYSGIFCGMRNLEWLDLGGNNFTSINDLGITCSYQRNCTPCLPKLTYLDVSYNNLSLLNLGSLIKDLPQLKKLNMTLCSLKSIILQPFWGNLEVVNLKNNLLSSVMINSVDRCENQTKLIKLNLENNQLNRFSSGFFKCLTNLEELDLSTNLLNTATLLDADIGLLSNLQKLDLSNNPLSHLPATMMSNMVALQQLTCTNINLLAIDGDIFANISNIEVLKLNKNKLCLLQNGTISHLTKLRILDLTENNLSSIHIDNRLIQLSELHIGTNIIKTLPDFSNERLSMTILDLSRNNIRALIPEKISGLRNLIGLSLSRNNIQQIPGYAFYTMNHLGVLNLADNEIRQVEYSSFQGLNELIHLKLENNFIEELDVYLIPLKSLQYLYMSNNKIQVIQQFTFPQSLQFIDLSYNQITDIRPKVFSHLDVLLAVNLTWNKIADLTRQSLMMSSRVWLRPQLFLSGNLIQCDCHRLWLRSINTNMHRNKLQPFPLIPDLNYIMCSSKFQGRGNGWFTLRNPLDFLCIYTNECLSINCHCCDIHTYCPCRDYCYDGCTCFRNQNYEVNTMVCTMRNLTSIPVDRAPFNAKEVLLDGNNLTRLTSDELRFPKLEILLVNDSGIICVDDRAFKNLKVIKDIYLQNNTITKVNRLTFGNLSSLEVLNLQNNKINRIEKSSFSQLISLQELLLHNNNLRHLDMTLFDPFLSSIVKLSLHGNPWQCDCESGPKAQRWLLAHSDVIEKAKHILCSYTAPSSEDSKFSNVSNIWRVSITEPIMDIRFTHCLNATIIFEERKQKLIIGTSSVAFIFLVFIFITICIYKNRLMLMVWVYAWYGFRFYNEEEDDDDKPYDVFLAHPEEDMDLILTEMLPKLEMEEMSYRVCLEARDWSPMESSLESMVASIQQSKRTLLLISENYFNSKWAKYEFQTAHYQVMGEKKVRLIVILMDKTMMDRIDQPDLNLYLKAGYYLYYNDPHFWNKLRYYLAENPRGVTDEPQFVNVTV